jgi:hypothetical protein
MTKFHEPLPLPVVNLLLVVMVTELFLVGRVEMEGVWRVRVFAVVWLFFDDSDVGDWEDSALGADLPLVPVGVDATEDRHRLPLNQRQLQSVVRRWKEVKQNQRGLQLQFIRGFGGR